METGTCHQCASGAAGVFIMTSDMTVAEAVVISTAVFRITTPALLHFQESALLTLLTQL